MNPNIFKSFPSKKIRYKGHLKYFESFLKFFWSTALCQIDVQSGFSHSRLKPFNKCWKIHHSTHLTNLNVFNEMICIWNELCQFQSYDNWIRLAYWLSQLPNGSISIIFNKFWRIKKNRKCSAQSQLLGAFKFATEFLRRSFPDSDKILEPKSCKLIGTVNSCAALKHLQSVSVALPKREL